MLPVRAPVGEGLCGGGVVMVGSLTPPAWVVGYAPVAGVVTTTPSRLIMRRGMIVVDMGGRHVYRFDTLN